MSIDPRSLRPGELCRALNSTPLGEVVAERQLHRHRMRAGFRIGDGKTIDLFRYVAWLSSIVHAPKPDKAPQLDGYDAVRERARARSLALSLSGRDIGELPEVADPERKEKACSSFREFCGAYFPATFDLPWSDDHLKVISKIERAVLEGGLFAMAMPRASGKTSLCETACIWAMLTGARRFVCLIGSGEAPAAYDGPPDPGPFPEHLLRVPGFMADVMAHNLATAHRPQPVLALAGAVTLQAVLAGRKVRDERGNRTNLYAVGVAPSGAGKDHARKVSKNVLFHAGLDALEANEDLASDAGLVSALEINPASLFQFDEFGRFLRTIGDAKKAPHLYNVLTALMKLYSSADTVFKGKAYADAKRNKVIDRPCAVVYGTTVPEHFFESLTADALADGFMARLLVFEADSTAVRQRAHATAIPEPILEAARWWGDFAPGGDLRRTNPDPVVVPTTPEAVAVYDRFALTVDAELAKDSPGRSLWARAEEKACRLALVHACSADRAKPVVGQEAAEWACAVSEHLTRRMLHLAHAWVSDGQFDSRQKRVLRAIRAAEGKISASELCRRTQWLSKRERGEVIENLLETGQIVMRSESTATRPRTVYAVA